LLPNPDSSRRPDDFDIRQRDAGPFAAAGERKPSLLFVDDDAYMRRLMTARLQHLGAQVEAVSSARDAMAFLESNRPDLVISDAVMPVMNGFDLCRQLKENPLYQDIPFVILTALARDLRQRSIDAGADDFLSKLENEVVFRLRSRLALELGVRLRNLPGPEPAPGAATVLVASAAKAIPAQVETHLQKSGIAVEQAASLDEALECLKARPPQLLALDLALEPVDLPAWIPRARALPGCSRLPIEILGTKEEDAAMAPLERLVQDRLLKPLDGQESRHRIGLLLRIARLQA